MLFNYSLLAWFGLSLAQVTYEGQQIWSCQVSNRDVADKLAHLDIFSHKNGVTTLRVKSDEEKAYVKGVAQCSVKVDNLNAAIQSESQLVRRDYPTRPRKLSDEEFFKNYQSYETLKEQYKGWAQKYKKFATFNKSIGRSIEGREIFTFDITDKSHRGQKKEIVYLGGLHAREWIAPASVAYIANQLLVNAEKDRQVANHLKKFVFRFIPLGNPDGYEYTRNGDRLWRKNRRNNGDGTFGVDLNRNFDNHWGVVGSSNDTKEEIYQGTGPASEPEVAAISKYIKSLKNAYGGIDFHSYGQLVLRNWGWVVEPSVNEPILKPMGDKVAAAFNKHGYQFTSELSAGLYPAGGAADDWMAETAKLVSLTIELCPNDDETGFELPPSELLKCAKATYDGSKTFAQFLLENPNIPPNSYTKQA